MSHLKNPPQSISIHLSSSVLCVAMMFSSGCAMVQIPSYRLEECASESYENTPTFTPTWLPPMPMPGWLARWKAQKDLPKPPEAPRFHPLPTRPMFQPQPTTDFGFDAPHEAASYGKLPPSESWNRAEPVPAEQVPSVADPI